MPQATAPSRPTAGVGDVVVGDTDSPPPKDEEEDPPANDDDKSTSGKDDKESTTKKDSNDKEDDKTTKAPARTTKIPFNAQPGGVQIKYPNPTDGYQIYKIGDKVTFGWNFTSVLRAPTKINVEAYCTLGAYYFTITKDAPGDLRKITWDTGAQQTSGVTKLPQ